MLTARRLRTLLTYNPRTGVFRWRVSHPGTTKGDIAGTTTGRGQRVIVVDGRMYPAGRLAWLHMTGRWPKHLISCINGDRTDVRWANLREITLAERQASRPASNKLGVKGVWKKRSGKYAAEIRVAGEKKYLGYFNTLDAASAAYLKAAKEAFGSFARAR